MFVGKTGCVSRTLQSFRRFLLQYLTKIDRPLVFWHYLSKPFHCAVFRVYSCVLGQCSSPLGVEDRSIPDSDITASSEYNTHHAPRLGRLNNVETGDDQGAWCASARVQGEWIQV